MSHPLTDANDKRPELPGEVEILSRREFLRLWHESYGPGQHVTFLGPTQRGKTRLSHEMLQVCISPDHKAVILSGKPPGRDPVMAQAAKRLNLRIVEEYPPLPNWKDRKRNGFVVRPHQTMQNIDADNAELEKQFRAAILSNYASKKPVITVADEAHHVQNDLKLKKEYEAPLMRGAPVNSMWSLIQRGRYMSYHAYGAPEHIIIFHDPDRSNQMRYSEIGGVDPKYVMAIVADLKTHRTERGNSISEALYIRRSGPELYIIDVA